MNARKLWSTLQKGGGWGVISRSLPVIAALVVVFGNCSRVDFKTNSLSSKSAVIDGRELLPLTLNLGFAVDPEMKAFDLPTGAIYDKESQRVLWIPQRHQAGHHQIIFDSPRSGVFRLNLAIASVADEDLASGPPAGYQDDEVGYIFIHGKGQRDGCNSDKRLREYWQGGDGVIAPDPKLRTLVCYDGRKDVSTEGPAVARQILTANCGKFNKCVVVTHSMGGLMIEHILLHAREATTSDTRKKFYDHAELYQKVREKTLFVISIASAAGGSKVADLVENPGSHRDIEQMVAGLISRWVGEKNDATNNLVPEFASREVAPMSEDPGVPIYMVAGFSKKILNSLGESLSGLLGFKNWSSNKREKYFNKNMDLAMLDRLVKFQSRSDGLVDFRSACGIQSDRKGDGPGNNSDLDENFEYCQRSPKKPNHFVWFAINLNHERIATNLESPCRWEHNPCEAYFPDPARQTLKRRNEFDQKSAVRIIRTLLTKRQESTDPPTIVEFGP